MKQKSNENISSSKRLFQNNFPQDLRLTTSQETNGKAVTRKRSGIASEFFLNLSHCRFVAHIRDISGFQWRY